MVFSYRVVRVVVFVSLSVDPGNMSQANKQQKPQHHHHHGNRSFSIRSFLCCPDGAMSRVETCHCEIVSRTPFPRPHAFSELLVAHSYIQCQRRAWERSNNAHRIEYREYLKNLNANCKSHEWHNKNEFPEDFWRNYIYSIHTVISCHFLHWVFAFIPMSCFAVMP